MTNNFIHTLENKFQGMHTRLKELHYSAHNISMHKLTEEFDNELQAFDDSVMENAQAIWGVFKPGDITPILPEAMDFENLLTDCRGLLVGIKKEAGDNMLWTGIISTVDGFFEVINKYLYLQRMAAHEE